MEAKSLVEVQLAKSKDWQRFYYKLYNGITLLYTIDKQGMIFHLSTKGRIR